MPDQLHARVEACYQQAEAFFNKRFERPQVSFKLRGQKAGVAHLNTNLLRFNPQLYQENSEHFLKLRTLTEALCCSPNLAKNWPNETSSNFGQ